VRFTQSFTVDAPPDAVFDYMTDPANLREWQTAKTRVEPLSDGPPRQGFRVREWTKPPGGREFEQVVEFAEFDRPRRFRVHVIEGPYPVDGTWSLAAADGGTRIDFVAEGELRGALKFATPLMARLMARQFAGYHEHLRRNVASA
jgi:uncharacterized protein YndB with AHSA1/START domain